MSKRQFGEPATLHRRIITGYDSAKRPLHAFEAVPLPTCVFAPNGGSGADLEPLEAGHSTVLQPARAYFRQPVEVAPGDRIEIRGRCFEVVGEPEVWLSPRTGTHAVTTIALQHIHQGA